MDVPFASYNDIPFYLIGAFGGKYNNVLSIGSLNDESRQIVSFIRYRSKLNKKINYLTIN